MELNSSPIVSVIVNNFGDLDSLTACLASLLQSDYGEIDVVVVDCLTQGIEEWIEKKFPKIKLVHLSRDVGPAMQANIGLRLANPRSKYIVFMDNDIEVDKGWLGPLVELMETDLTIGAAQPRILRKKEPMGVDNAGCFLDPTGYPFRIGFTSEDDPSHYTRVPIEVFYAETATMIVRRDLLNRFPEPLNPFDGDYFIHFQDVDLCWRIWLAEFRVVLIPNSLVYHERGVSGGLYRLSPRSVFLNTRNRVATLFKNYSMCNLVRYIPILIMLELLKVVVLLGQKPSHAAATVKGHLWIWCNIRAIWKKREEVQRLVRKTSDSYVLSRFIRLNLLRLYRDFKRHYPN